MIVMKDVDSSMFLKAGYDENTRSAHLLFKNHKTYSYPMTKETFEALMAAESIGKHFAQHVRKQFAGVLITSESTASSPTGPGATSKPPVAPEPVLVA